MALARLDTCPILNSLHFNAHAARAAGDRANRRIHVGRREIRHFRLRDFLGLLTRHLPTLSVWGLALPLSTPAAFLISTVAGGSS